ncbi:hypothetical protein B9Z19DRAFT_1063436 [Tuber borchii]|uniref:Uncharacterized protein n=1 Tax=Tuber borchii TaxID=42251 RepID=A0A2T6ZYA7_TUBBO|nr:hypothetical protein B9Z19DRAFT_1063436 [Tuber borchii]
MWGRYITTGAILLLAATTNGLPLADDAHLVMGGHYKTNLGKRTEPVTPQTQPGHGLPPPTLPPTTTTLHVSPPGVTTQLGAPGTTGAGGQNPPVGSGAVGQRPSVPGGNSQPMPSTGSASNGATPTPHTHLPVGQGQPGSLQPGTTSGLGSPSPTGVKPGGAHEEDQNTPPKNTNSKPQSRTSSSSSSSSKPKPKATGYTDLPGALSSPGGISANGVPTGVAPVPSPPGPEAAKPPASTGLGDVGTSIVPGGVSSTVTSVPGHIRSTVTPSAGPPVGQGLQSPTGNSGQQFVVNPLNAPLSQTVSTPLGQVSPLANPAVQNPSLPGSAGPTLTQPLGATGSQPPAFQRVPALARRQQVNGLNPEKTSTTSTSTSTKPQKTKTVEPKPKEEDSSPELRYELAEDSAGDKPETVGVSRSSSRKSSTTTRTPTPPPVMNNEQPAPQQPGGPQPNNPPVWIPPQLLYESVGGMIDTPVFYPNIYPPPNPGPVVMMNENTRTTTRSTATSTSPPAPTGSGPTLVHESIDTQDPDAAVIKAAPLSHDLPSTRKVHGRHGADLPLYENVGPTSEKPAAIGPADSKSTTTTYTPLSNTLPPNTVIQTTNPALLYESSGDGKDPVALPVIADSRTTTSATTGSSQGPSLKYEYGPGDNYPGAGVPAPILPTQTGPTDTVHTSAQPTGGGPALKYEFAGAENQQSSAYISTVTTTVYQPQPTQPPPVLKYEYVGAENLVANPPISTTTITHTLTTTPAPGGAGQPGLLYELAGNGDPSPVDVQSTTTSFVTSYTTTTPPTSTTPIPQGQQQPTKPLALRHGNEGQGVTDTRVTPSPTGGPSSHLSSQHEKRHEQGSPEEKVPSLMHEAAAADPVSSAPPNPVDIIDTDGTHPRRKRNEVHRRGFVGVDGVASAHSPADHGKRVRRSRQFRA